MTHLTHEDISRAARHVAIQMAAAGHCKAFPVPRGGIPAAYAIQQHYPMLQLVASFEEADCCIDDLVDSGNTRDRFPGKPFYTLFDKQVEDLGWLVFPWEATLEQSAEDIGTRLLQFIGEDPTREGLQETPVRFLKAWQEWTSGYSQDPACLFKDFGDGAENYDEMVIIDPIPFYSHCEHHLAAIFGSVHIAYIPNGRIAGLSKFARLVDVYTKRLQVQERLTVQIAEDIVKYLEPLGVGVVVRARHFCMESRGAKKPGAETTTVALRGVLKDGAPRAEFLSLIKGR